MKILTSKVPRGHRENFHLLPGRLRVGIPGLLHNQERAFVLAHRLAQIPGVKVGYANPLTGQVLINFDPLKTDLEDLLDWVSDACDLGRPGAEPDILPRKSTSGCPPAELQAGMPAPARERLLPWHVFSGPNALALLESSMEIGLSHREAQERLARFGPNELPEGQKSSFWKVALGSLNGFMSKLLLAAGAVSLLVGEKADAAVIIAIVVVQAAVEAAQSCRAEKSLQSLQEFAAPLATVLREGKTSKIPGKGLVPGDILHLQAGNVVPADAIILGAVNLTTNEACLTGESIPVPKDNRKKDDPRVPIADQGNMLFSGTSIIGGRAVALVVSTGMQTELGRIARLLSAVQDKKTNLQKQLDYLGKKITHLVVLSVGVIAVISLLRGRPFWDVLRSGISLAVGAVPEGLPAVLTVALASGVQRMAKRNALVRNLSAVETLGSTTVICTDKTGTLTKNEMTVKELYLDEKFFTVTGNGYRPEGKILRRVNGVDSDPGENALAPVRETLKAAALCNNAELRPDHRGRWLVLGDPTEGALLTVAAKAGLWWEDLQEQYCRHREVAFDARRCLMTVVCRETDGQYSVYIKGAPDAVVNYCSTVLGEAGVRVLDLKTRRKILIANEKMAQKALRVLGIAQKRLPAGTDLDKEDWESDLIFCGLAGMADIPREGVREAIGKCRAAGIKVVMITGDHQKTAEAVAAQLGLRGQGESITGRELEQIPDAQFAEMVESISIYSRTTPDQKLRIVRALKNSGQVVTMTGDGVNDAPAIKEADLGIAMGATGTDVTREVAGITLSDDNFVTIVNGVEEGRTVSMNLSKAVGYILAGSLGQLLSVFTSTVLGLPVPLVPAQILWINLVTESLPAIALTADPPEENYMDRPPLQSEGKFLADQGGAILRKGIILGLTTFSLYAAGSTWGRWTLSKARTMAFAQLVMNKMFELTSTGRTKKGRARGAERNPLILPAAALSTSLLAMTMYLPFMRPLFSTVPLNLHDWLLISANAFVSGKIDILLENRGRGADIALQPIPNTVKDHTQSGNKSGNNGNH